MKPYLIHEEEYTAYVIPTGGRRIPNKCVYGDPIDFKKFSYFKNGEFYGCLNLTENEHYIIKDELEKFCKANVLVLHYYRKLKRGHVPCYREFKVSGHSLHMSLLDKFLEEHKLFEHMERNPNTIEEKRKNEK
jgi:hypothetical protein